MCAQCPKRLEEGGRCSETTTDCCESPCGCWEPNHWATSPFTGRQLFLNTPVYRSTPLPCKPHLGCAVSFYIFLSGPWGYREQCSCSPASAVPSCDPSALCSALRSCRREMVLCGPGEISSIRVRWLKRAGLFTWPWERQGRQAGRLQASCSHNFRGRLRVAGKKLTHCRNKSRKLKIQTSSSQIFSLRRSELLNCL